MADGEQRLYNLLEKIALEQDYQNHEIQIKPISTGGANYTSKLFLATISADGKDDLKLFAKVAIIGQKIREQTENNMYDNELFMYTKVFTRFRELEDKHDLPEEHRLRLTKYYGADTTDFQEILVLEDLMNQGYELHNRFESVEWPYAAAAVTELAKYHALSIVYKHHNSEEFKGLVEKLGNGMFSDNKEFESFYNISVKNALAAVREENKDKLQLFLQTKNISSYPALYKAMKHEVIIHGDFRPSNMLHRTNENGCIELIPVDYQTIQGACPVIDLLYFIFCASDGPFRAKYYDRLVDHYHAELGAALLRFGLEVEEKYSRADFDSELKEKLVYGLLISVALLPLLTVAEADAPSMEGSEDMNVMTINKTSARYAELLNDLVDDFVTWGVLS